MLKLTFVTIMTALLVGLAAARPAALHGAGGQSGSTAQARVVSDRMLVDGRPFFPIMVLGQCTKANVARARALGINLFMSGECASVSPKRQLALVRHPGLAVLPVAGRTVRGRALAGWTFPDEPENNKWTPDALRRAYPYRRGSEDGLLSFMTTGAGFFTHAAGTPPRAVYRRFARMADVSGFDLYPLGHCQKDLVSVYDAQRDFAKLAGTMPTFQWIETGPIVSTYCGGFAMHPDELRAEVWLAIAGGARGIGYFTHTWSPRHRTFDVRPEIQAEMRRTNERLRTLTPALLGARVPATVDSGSIKLIARQTGARTTIFAVNSTRNPIKAQLFVGALDDRPVRVDGEGRTLQSHNRGVLIDHFAPLGVHVYVAG